MTEINPKMQPKIRTKHRNWQIEPTHVYGYGQCPRCGVCGDSVGEWQENDSMEIELFHCDTCNITYSYQHVYAYRFHEIEDDEAG